MCHVDPVGQRDLGRRGVRDLPCRQRREGGATPPMLARRVSSLDPQLQAELEDRRAARAGGRRARADTGAGDGVERRQPRHEPGHLAHERRRGHPPERHRAPGRRVDDRGGARRRQPAEPALAQQFGGALGALGRRRPRPHRRDRGGADPRGVGARVRRPAATSSSRPGEYQPHTSARPRADRARGRARRPAARRADERPAGRLEPRRAARGQAADQTARELLG